MRRRRSRPASSTPHVPPVPHHLALAAANRCGGGLALRSAVSVSFFFCFFCGFTGLSVRAACSATRRWVVPEAVPPVPINSSGRTHRDRRVEPAPAAVPPSHPARSVPAQPRRGTVSTSGVCLCRSARAESIAKQSVPPHNVGAAIQNTTRKDTLVRAPPPAVPQREDEPKGSSRGEVRAVGDEQPHHIVLALIGGPMEWCEPAVQTQTKNDGNQCGAALRTRCVHLCVCPCDCVCLCVCLCVCVFVCVWECARESVCEPEKDLVTVCVRARTCARECVCVCAWIGTA